MLGRVLRLEGYDVAASVDGTSALTLLEEYAPDLVILDIMMPGPDGFQVLDSIRQRSNIPVVMLTAKCEKSSLDIALALGADDYIEKPLSIRELVARIRAKLRCASPGVTLPESPKSTTLRM